MTIKTNVKAGGINWGNHNERGVAVKSAVKAGWGGIMQNHAQGGLKLNAKVKAGALTANHAQGMAVKSVVKAGGITYNHNQTK